jgi:sRNA-binding carbon storage regulator CsrA
MLVLGRQITQSVLLIIPPSATETVVKVTLNDVNRAVRNVGAVRCDARIGFDAPRDVIIEREEIAGMPRRAPHVRT